MSTFLQRFIAEARRQTNVNTESPEIHRIRMTAATLSIVIGILVLAPLSFGNFRASELPGLSICVLGALLGVGAHVAKDTLTSRRLGLAAFVSTAAGIGWLIAIRVFF